MKDEKICCICGDNINGWGCNPEPFSGGECCQDCDDRWVIPVRLCLGRSLNDENILMLLKTIAELGKALKQAHPTLHPPVQGRHS